MVLFLAKATTLINLTKLRDPQRQNYLHRPQTSAKNISTSITCRVVTGTDSLTTAIALQQMPIIVTMLNTSRTTTFINYFKLRHTHGLNYRHPPTNTTQKYNTSSINRVVTGMVPSTTAIVLQPIPIIATMLTTSRTTTFIKYIKLRDTQGQNYGHPPKHNAKKSRIPSVLHQLSSLPLKCTIIQRKHSMSSICPWAIRK